eukprot:CAMPEP_0172921666 /NCGR_PEP_ID=MMETSP1075-20121228/206388_1 /TAXON_ID=2916 /ORGANISM="Ceratium fusus, Strain PA161109" /LENGTH=97 /DNA_ID=CAMNT_0013781865 /DNA_START=355 /DNA_END=645 /DNA_ORIENTATION=-
MDSLADINCCRMQDPEPTLTTWTLMRVFSKKTTGHLLTLQGSELFVISARAGNATTSNRSTSASQSRLREATASTTVCGLAFPGKTTAFATSAATCS